jgi:hypothetical protein
MVARRHYEFARSVFQWQPNFNIGAFASFRRPGRSGGVTQMARTSIDIEEPYGSELEGILQFSTFEEAEKTIRDLEKICRKYAASRDKKGMEYCRKIALLGRGRAELISRNHRVSALKRRQKKEISEWFRLWLETPDLFDDWLKMRKLTEEFRTLSRESGLATDS